MKIVIDCVFFQINEWSGITRYWMNIIEDLDNICSSTENLDVYLLVRGKSKSLRTHDFKAINVLPIAYFDPICAFSDYEELGNLCKSLRADFFISTYYTLAFDVANIGISYDYIAESMNWMDNHIWKLKEIYMRSLTNIICISESTKSFASLFYQNLNNKDCDVLYPSLSETECSVVQETNIKELRAKYNLHFPYIAVVGHRGHYKNFGLLTDYLETRHKNQLPLNAGIVVTSGEELSIREEKLYSASFVNGIKRISLSNTEMPVFLSAAETLFYPSLLEGFGYPVVESLIQGTPVITTGSTSISEIIKHTSGDEALIITGYDPKEAFMTLAKSLNQKQEVSEKTVQILKEKFKRNTGNELLEILSKENHINTIVYADKFSQCLSLDGIIC